MKQIFNTYYRLLKEQNYSSYIPDISIDLSKIKIIKIYNSENIILQDSQNNSYRKLVDVIYNCKNGQQFTNKDVLKFTSDNFKYKEFIKQYNILPFYVFKTDFSSAKGIYSIFCYLDSSFKSKFPEISLFNQAFIQDYQSCNGLLIELGPCYLMLLNSNNYNSLTIQHQLYHYFYLSIPSFQRIQNFIDTLNIPDEGIPEFNLDKEKIEYCLTEYQLNAYVHVNLFKELKSIYYLYYQNIERKQFLNFVFNSIEQLSCTELKNSELFKSVKHYLSRYNKIGLDNNYLVLLKICYLFNKQNYNQIKQKLMNYL